MNSPHERNHARPLLLGYIRADVLRSGTDLPRVEADLAAFAEREEFSLGTIYVERGGTPGAFHALMDELDRNETAWGVAVPDLRHVTDEEHLVIRAQHEDHSRPRILVANFTPLAGGPGADSPVRQACRSTPPR